MKNRILIILGALLCLTGISCWLGGRALQSWQDTPLSGDRTLVAVEIPRGASLDTLTPLLVQKNVIQDPRLFYFWARWIKRCEPKWGELAFRHDMTPIQVLRVLTEARPVIHHLKIPPGLTLEQVAALIRESDLEIRGDFLKQATDESFTRSLGIKARSVEGYLEPGDYGFAKYLDAQTVIRSMVARRYSKWDKKLRNRARALRWDLHKVLTLASIIEAETSKPDEREKIASVLYNRLIHEWKLCSDATAAYAARRAQLSTSKGIDRTMDDPYNTWIHRGLPPSPICSASDESVHAALWPVHTSAMYFVALPDGQEGHKFCPDLLCALGRHKS